MCERRCASPPKRKPHKERVSKEGSGGMPECMDAFRQGPHGRVLRPVPPKPSFETRSACASPLETLGPLRLRHSAVRLAHANLSPREARPSLRVTRHELG